MAADRVATIAHTSSLNLSDDVTHKHTIDKIGNSSDHTSLYHTLSFSSLPSVCYY